MPIHGEYRHLAYHPILAKNPGIPKKNIFILEDGGILEISRKEAGKNGRVNSARILLVERALGMLKRLVLRDSLRLVHDGIVLILLSIEKLTGNIVSRPDIISRGFVFDDALQEIINDVKIHLTDTVKGPDKRVISDSSVLQAKLRNKLEKIS